MSCAVKARHGSAKDRAAMACNITECLAMQIKGRKKKVSVIRRVSEPNEE